MEPFFSVLMPTRNRASLLQSSLRSAINQEFQDYEIIVSDNNSTDDTRVVVERLMGSSKKIQYVNPGRDLSMSDNWEFALSHAGGRYLVLLCDDDALARNSLFYIHQVLTQFQIEVLVWPYAGYHHPDFPDENQRLTFSFNYGSGDLFEVASKPVIDALFRFDWRINGIIPKMLNCTASRKAIEACRNRTGDFFIPPFPDFSAVGQLLGTNRSYHFIDLPLFVSGASRLSNAAILFDRKRIFDAYASLFGHDLLEGVPYQMRYLCTSYFYATWLFFIRTYPRTFNGPLDTEAYLKALFTELSRYGDHEDLSKELEVLSAHMRDFSGSEEMFKRLWQDHEQAKANGVEQGNASLTLQFKRMGWDFIRRNEGVYNLLARARGHRIVKSSHKDVPSIAAAAKILSNYLSRQARRIDELKAIQISSADFLKQRR